MPVVQIVNNPAFAEIIAAEVKTPKLKDGKDQLMLLQSQEKPR